MPRPKRPPPGFTAEPRYPRQRTAAAAAAPASASAPSPGSGAAGGGRGCCDLSRAFGRCRALLDDLLRHDDGWVFEAPVDARALGLRDYYTVVADPMDLGTVLRRLERRRYLYPTAFAADVRLTFQNALSYNNEGDPVYESAAELSEIFEARWASIQAELPHPPPTDAERMVGLNDKLPRLPVAGVLEERNVGLLEKKRKMAVNLGEADAAAPEKKRKMAVNLVPQHGAAHADVNSPMQVILVAMLVKFTLWFRALFAFTGHCVYSSTIFSKLPPKCSLLVSYFIIHWTLR